MSFSEVLLPKEHGAYGQVGFPLATAFAVAGFSAAGALLAAAVVAGFLAHEPAAIVLGHRGGRARRECRAPAARSLAVCLMAGCAAAVGVAMAIDAEARWSLFVPAVPAALLAGAMVAGCEKSWYGEVLAACAFASVPVPIVLAAGASSQTAVSVAVPFALLFVATTLAVRVVVLRVRGGGNPAAETVTRYATLAVAGASGALLAAATAAGWMGPSVPVASAPGLLVAAIVAVRPPPAARLRTLGWSLVAVSTLTALLVILVTV